MSKVASNYNEELKIWNGGAYRYHDQIKQSIGEVFLRNMRFMDSHKVLEYHYDTQEERTAGQIYIEAVSVALNLSRLGIKKGDVVILHMLNIKEVTPLALGCYLIGAIVNYSDVNSSKADVEVLYGLMQPSAVFYETKFWKGIKETVANLKSVKISLPVELNTTEPNVYSEVLVARSIEEIDSFKSCHVSEPDKEIASLVMTSGSTGTPKLVELTHSLQMHGILNWWPEGLQSDSVIFSLSPLRWISQVGCMLQSMLLGVKRICACGNPSGKYGADIIRTTKPSHIFFVAGLYLDILNAIPENDCTSFSSLRYIALGGDPPTETIMRLARSKSQLAKVYNAYGMTEAAGALSYDEHFTGGELRPGLEVKILDTQRRPVGPNVPGQVAIRTVVRFRGYFKRDSASSFLEDGFFVNGDYGLVDGNGKIHLRGRYKDLIRAENITIVPDTIESMVGLMPGIDDARLVPYHVERNQSDIGALFVVPTIQTNEDEDILRVKIRELLHSQLKPLEAAILQDIHIVPSLPLTSCGKLNRPVLQKIAASLKQRIHSIYSQFRKEMDLLDY